MIYQAEVELLSPVALALRRSTGNDVDTLRHLPGTTLRGALASEYLSTGGSPEDEDFQNLFLRGRVHYGQARPERAIPWPLSARRCRDTPTEHRILDRLVATGAGCRTSEKCPEAVYPGPNKCGAKLEIPPGFVRFHAKNNVYEEIKPKVLRAAHVAIDPRSGRAVDKMLFSQRSLERGQTFTAQWSVADEARAALERLVPDEGVLLRLGKAKSRQGGEVRLRLTKIELSEKSRTDRIDTLQAAAQKLGGRLAGKKVVSITLLSPAIVVDEFLRSRSWIEPEDVGLSGDWAPAAWFSELVCISGWHAAAMMPRSEDWAMAAGSCFLFAGTGTQDLAEWMGELEENGIGERRDRGFGEVRCCDEFHARQAEGGVR